MKIFSAFTLLLFVFGSFAQHDSSMQSFSPVQTNFSSHGVGVPAVRIVINKSFKQTGGWTEKLKNIGKVNIIYSYDNMGVCEYKSEKSYLEHKQKKYSTKKYAKFLKGWDDMRKISMEPKFLELFTNILRRSV